MGAISKLLLGLCVALLMVPIALADSRDVDGDTFYARHDRVSQDGRTSFVRNSDFQRDSYLVDIKHNYNHNGYGTTNIQVPTKATFTRSDYGSRALKRDDGRNYRSRGHAYYTSDQYGGGIRVYDSDSFKYSGNKVYTRNYNQYNRAVRNGYGMSSKTGIHNTYHYAKNGYGTASATETDLRNRYYVDAAYGTDRAVRNDLSQMRYSKNGYGTSYNSRSDLTYLPYNKQGYGTSYWQRSDLGYRPWVKVGTVGYGDPEDRHDRYNLRYQGYYAQPNYYVKYVHHNEYKTAHIG